MIKSFVEELNKNKFEGDIYLDEKTLDKYSTDESIFCVKPKMVLAPLNAKDIALTVKIVNKFDGLSLTPRLAGTGLSGGSLNDSIILDLTKYFDVIYSIKKQNDEEYLIDLDCGVYYKDLETQMKKENIYIPSYPASKDICTIGGMVANNAAGPDTFCHGQTDKFVKSIDIILADCNLYTITPLNYSKLKQELKRKDLLGDIYRYIWNLLQKNEKQINEIEPKTRKNSSGYAIWKVLNVSVEEFIVGAGEFDLCKLIVGSQGTIGIVTRIKMLAVKRPKYDSLVYAPVFSNYRLGDIIKYFIEKKPTNIELFDGKTLKAGFKHPLFIYKNSNQKNFINFISIMYRFLFSFRKHSFPNFVLLASFNKSEKECKKIVEAISKHKHIECELISCEVKKSILWSIRRSSYSLSKLGSNNKRPAAFLEDIVVLPEFLPDFLKEMNALFHKHNVHAYVHGHGGDGHLHFYPMLDFRKREVPQKIKIMANDFFNSAAKFNGTICGEHNDGIIRTPYMHLIFNKFALNTFNDIENIFDKKNIFNPGKKVNPKFNLETSIRHTN